MAKRCLIDTSVLIQTQKGDQKVINLLTVQANPLISIVTACEILYGSANTKQLKINKEVLNNFEILGVDSDTSYKALDLIGKYGLRSRVGVTDALIAATAIVNNYSLWTLNTKHFKVIKEIELFEE